MLCLRARIGRAASSTLGAITASMNVETIASASSTSMGRFTATMPPKAARLSASRARTYASTAEVPIAAPHGFVCLITAAAGSSNSRTIRSGGVEIEEVGERELFALQDVGCTERPGWSQRTRLRNVPRRALMRIFAVAEIADLVERDIERVGQRRQRQTDRARTCRRSTRSSSTSR